MASSAEQSISDVRALAGTREVLAYKDGGLFPVLALLPDGAIVAVLRGGAGHLGLSGRIEVIRSLDGGLTWTPPAIVADSDRDDRNPAIGATSSGALVLAYHRQGGYDDAGTYQSEMVDAGGDRPIEIMLTRSADSGRTWDRPVPLGVEVLRTCSPYGKIVILPDGTLLMAIYGYVRDRLPGGGLGHQFAERRRSYVVRSGDDGRTWGEPALIAAGMNETALLALPGGDVLAVLRGDDERALWCARSGDGGRAWSEPEQITGPNQHPADLALLANGDILLTYGNRTPPYRIEGRISRDGGRTWLPTLLAFSGHLYGYNVAASRPTDLGYPSSVVRRDGGAGRGVTMYYYNPSHNRPSEGQGAGDPRYSARDYLAVAVSWDEAALIAAVERHATEGEGR